MENSSFLLKICFLSFFLRNMSEHNLLAAVQFFVPSLQKSLFSPKILKIRLFFLFFVEPESRNQPRNALIIVDGIEMKKKILKILAAKKHR
jgi:hypothetical protein